MLAKPGNYTIGLGDKDLEKHIREAHWESSLDAPATLTVELALPLAKFKALTYQNLPQNASVRWADKGLFQGSLLSAKVVDECQVTLVFADKLLLTKKIYENNYAKQQTLQNYLQKIVQSAGLSAEFKGSFSNQVPSVEKETQSNFEDLIELSQTHGFHFVVRGSGSSVTFIKLNQSVQKVSIDAKKTASIAVSQSVEPHIASAKLRYFDSHKAESKDKALSKSELYAPLGGLSSHAGFDAKFNWTLAQGKAEQQETEVGHYDAENTFLKDTLSKRVLGAETLKVTLFEPSVCPGDMVSVSSPIVGGLQSGDFLAHTCRVAFVSAVPKLEVFGVRA